MNTVIGPGRNGRSGPYGSSIGCVAGATAGAVSTVGAAGPPVGSNVFFTSIGCGETTDTGFTSTAPGTAGAADAAPDTPSWAGPASFGGSAGPGSPRFLPRVGPPR